MSRDGTVIGYRQFGRGPGLVVLHGTMSSAHNHMQLAEALAEAFTVYVPDRRGRCQSGPYSQNYNIREEIEDLGALLAATGARNVFGVSSGGVICLQAALALPGIDKIAVFEPPLFMDSAFPTSVLTRYDSEIARGKLAAALVTAMKGAQMGPPIFRAMPRWLLERLTNMAMAGEEKKGSSDYVTMRKLAPLLHYDLRLVAENSGDFENYRAISTEVLLLGGSKSPPYLKTALDELEKVLQHAIRLELPGLDHAASWNSDRGGKPEPVAHALRQFFS
ncbi:hypothetical protein SD70_03725 [Gordoniibacillus kamchatkensis]|uniref:AB hydrolase-1 domain-containing protein n=1 Tax=Gordoniibacillus kamchatkensis TaxID=1590651 RepID=A0ABR5AM61_9BACL|nr:hypothetical protein SD70_03725 [Paenibacillus sp. VKM B-2647]